MTQKNPQEIISKINIDSKLSKSEFEQLNSLSRLSYTKISQMFTPEQRINLIDVLSRQRDELKNENQIKLIQNLINKLWKGLAIQQSLTKPQENIVWAEYDNVKNWDAKIYKAVWPNWQIVYVSTWWSRWEWNEQRAQLAREYAQKNKVEVIVDWLVSSYVVWWNTSWENVDIDFDEFKFQDVVKISNWPQTTTQLRQSLNVSKRISIETLSSNNKTLRDLQEKLKDLWIKVNWKDITIDWKFWNETRQAIVIFQKNNGLKVDWILWKNTFDKLFSRK